MLHFVWIAFVISAAIRTALKIAPRAPILGKWEPVSKSKQIKLLFLHITYFLHISHVENLSCGNISPQDRFFLHGNHPWYPWQIWGTRSLPLRPLGRSGREIHAEILLGDLEKYSWPYLKNTASTKVHFFRYFPWIIFKKNLQNLFYIFLLRKVLSDLFWTFVSRICFRYCSELVFQILFRI